MLSSLLRAFITPQLLRDEFQNYYAADPSRTKTIKSIVKGFQNHKVQKAYLNFIEEWQQAIKRDYFD